MFTKQFTLAFAALSTLTSASPLLRPRSCASPSFDWAVSDFVNTASYTFSTPAHQISSGTVSFNITNTAIPQTTACSATSEQLEDFFYGTQNYTCPWEGGDLTFNYNAPAKVLNVFNTWDCGEGVSYYSAGNTTLSPVCTTTSYQNPNWSEGEIYSSKFTNCTEAAATVTPFAAPVIVN